MSTSKLVHGRRARRRRRGRRLRSARHRLHRLKTGRRCSSVEPVRDHDGLAAASPRGLERAEDIERVTTHGLAVAEDGHAAAVAPETSRLPGSGVSSPQVTTTEPITLFTGVCESPWPIASLVEVLTRSRRPAGRGRRDEHPALAVARALTIARDGVVHGDVRLTAI